MHTYYIVTMNNNYMNSFKTYTDACEFRDNLERRFGRNAKIEIISCN